MPDLPKDTGRLTTNTEDGFLSGRPNVDWLTEAQPRTDAARVPPNLSGTKPDSFDATYTKPSVPSPVEAMSIATRAIDAPAFGTNLITDRHEPLWLDRSKPHVSPEAQGKDLRRGRK